MTKPQKGGKATKALKAAGWTVAGLVALIGPGLALCYNVDWTGDSPVLHNAVAAFLVVAAALAFEASRRMPLFSSRMLMIAVGFMLVVNNTQTAFETAASKSDRRSDRAEHLKRLADTARLQRSQWSVARDEQAKVAGETAVGVHEAALAQAIASDPRQWRVSIQCTAPNGPVTGAYCTQVAAAKAKVEAANKRDELDAKIQALDAKVETTEAPITANPYADGIAAVALAVGIRMGDEQKDSWSALRYVLFALALEAAASLWPMMWLGALGIGKAMVKKQAPAATRPSQTVKRETPAEPKAQSAIDHADHFHSFIADTLEDASGAKLKASEAWEMWQGWCEEKGLTPGNQKSFGLKMKSRFAHDKTNNRPKYLNVRLKSKAPSLHIVASN